MCPCWDPREGEEEGDEGECERVRGGEDEEEGEEEEQGG